MGCQPAKPQIDDQWYEEVVGPWRQARAASGKVFVITGCTTGMGYELALTVAKMGGATRIVMLNRASDRAEAARAKIQEAAGAAAVEALECDLTSFHSVRGACAALKGSCADEGIDVLACNAGIMAMDEIATQDGFDIQAQVNHLSHFLLVAELWPLLERAAEKRGEARVAMHTSTARNHPQSMPIEEKYFQKITKPGCLGGTGTSMYMGGANWVRYHHSKLANVVFAMALFERCRAAGSRVRAFCAEPGLAASELQQTAAKGGGMNPLEHRIMHHYMQSAADGSLPLTACCLKPGLASGAFLVPENTGLLMGNEHVNGQPIAIAEGGVFVDPDFEKEPSNRANHDVLWKVSEEATGTTFAVKAGDY